MSKIELWEADRQESRASTAGLIQRGGVNYKVYRGFWRDGSGIKIIVGQDCSEDTGQLSWHMSISCKKPLEMETIKQIVAQCWPPNLPGSLKRRQNFGLNFVHVFEVALPAQ